MKTCSKCKVPKSFEEFGNDKKRKDGKKSSCKACEKAHREKPEVKARLLETSRKWKAENKERANEQSRNWNQENKERFEQTSKKWREENKEHKREYSKKWGEENRERKKEYNNQWQQENKEHTKQYKKKYRQENKELLSVSTHKRLAMKKSLPNTWTLKEREYCFSIFKGCALTGDSDFHYDHVIPLNVGHGGTTKENMIPLRSDLNLSKNDSNLFEWYAQNRERFKLSEDKFKALVEYLARLNNMTPEEYREYVYECYSVRA